MKTSTITLITFSILFTVSLSTRVHAQSDVDLSSVPSCSTQQIADWTHVRDKMLGVAGRDVVGHEVGFSGARKRFGPQPLILDLGGNWRPISGYKETLCGTLDHFSFFPGVWDIDREEDWNNFFMPDEDFKYLISDAKQLFPKAVGSTPKCQSNNEADCIEVEVTVHDDFFQNPYFTRNRKFLKNRPCSILTGHKLCTYGTWIHEKVHSDHPELHPSELFWWTSPPSPPGTSLFSGWWLLAVQDNSNRFNSPTDFDPDLVETMPWAGSPRISQFRLAVELKPGSPVLSLRVNQRENHGVMPSQEDTGTTHLVTLNRVPLARVVEGQATENVGVGFDFCRDDAANRFVGYVDLTTRIQTDDKRNSGFQVLQVIKEGEPAPAAGPTSTPCPPVEAVTEFRLVPDSLKRIEVNGQPRLVADVKAEVSDVGPENRGDVPWKKMRLLRPGKKENIQIDRGAVDAATRQPTNQFLLHDVPLALGQPQSGPTFEVETPQGKQTIEIKGIALVPEVRHETVLAQSPEEGSLETLLVAAGLGPAAQPESFPAVNAVKAQQVTLDLIPTYAVLREDGTPAREEESPLVSALNESVRKTIQDNNLTAYKPLFGVDVPFRVVSWTYKAVNLVTGEEVPVREVSEGTDAADTGEVRVTRGTGNVSNGNLKVLFPKQTPHAVYELQLTATMTDTNNYTGKFEHRLWSHFIRVPKTEENINNFLKMVAERAGASYDQLALLWQARGNQIVLNSQTRRARIFHTLGLQSVEDEKVKLDELQALTRAAKLAGQR